MKKILKAVLSIILILIIVTAVLVLIGDSKEVEEVLPDAVEVNYTEYTVKELVEDLEANPLKANEKYKETYVELEGMLVNIDSDGKYIGLNPTNEDFSIYGVQCYLKTADHKVALMEMNIGDTITVKGKIRSVGEVLGYSMDIDEIKGH